ncbi:MAG: hypothetical protein SPL05_02595 [Eubacteriales bacterium]|nr:hypothetical protein [Eubacteriales bacterium]
MMPFSKNLGLQLYVDDVAAEKAFFQSIGFTILKETEMAGYPIVTMKTCNESSVLFTIYAKEFIWQVSPAVIDMMPSILFETENIEALQTTVYKAAPECSEIAFEPFPNFHFATPNGMHYAVKGIK